MKLLCNNFYIFSLSLCLILSIFLQGIHGRSLYIGTTPSPVKIFDPFGDPNLNQDGNTTRPEVLLPPKIDEIDITSNIQFRYSKTVVKAYIKNPSVSTAQEVKFNMILPSTAFISNFTIHIRGEDQIYVAIVEEKEEARESYREAVSRGQSAGIVDADTRNVNHITVRSHLKAASKMEFTLTYEELLKRHISRYEHIIHIRPGQLVENYNVNVYINESLPITYITVPELKTSENEITSLLEDNTIAKIKKDVDGDPRKAHIKFAPTIEDQRRMAKTASNAPEGMAGQFIVQYDVNRKNQGSDVQVLDGYFVHFFAPDYLTPLPKHVVFVLDISGSMFGTKLVQLKDAMMTILDDLSEKDYFNILTFSTRVNQWKPNQRVESKRMMSYHGRYATRAPIIDTTTPRDRISGEESKLLLTNKGTDAILKKATKYVLNLNDGGGTNINDALIEAVNVVRNVRISETIPTNAKPMIIFLTDGEATQGITDKEQIRKNVAEANKNLKIPIYGLAFGTGADFSLIKAIGTESGAFSRRIYEASDAAIQLEDFYAEISSPLLTNVSFNYVGEAFKNKTNKKLGTFFKGSEYIIAGKLESFDVQQEDIKEELEIVVIAEGRSSTYSEKILLCEDIPMPRPLPVEHRLDDGINIQQIGHNITYQNISEPMNITDPSNMIYVPEYPCISWPIPPILPNPNVDPPNEKSDSENFIERLWAYLTIENLLDEKLSRVEVEKMRLQGYNNTAELLVNTTKSNEDKALGLALEYNFVTKLTSLVVIQPDSNTTQNNEVSNGTIVNPVPINSISHRPNLFRPSYRSFGRNAFPVSGRSFMSQGPVFKQSSRKSSSRTNLNSLSITPRISHHSISRSGNMGYGGSTHKVSKSRGGGGMSRSRKTMSRGGTVQHGHIGSGIQNRMMMAPVYDSSEDDEDYLDDLVSVHLPSPTSLPTATFIAPTLENISPFPTIRYDDTNRNNYPTPPWPKRHRPKTTKTTITTTTPKVIVCQIKLFPKTYLRGTSVIFANTLNSTIADLSSYSFDDKLKSLEVQGPCCWDIFQNANFMGYRKRFRAGKYKSSTMLGADLVKEASSVRISKC